MKKNLLYIFFLLFLLSCNKDDDNLIFEKTADERKSEAIVNLKNSLTAPENGWKLQYKPASETGSFNVILKFDENNKVNIKSDLGSDDGEYYDQTVSYRIDSSLGLELIFETYSFFSFLFEQDQANFGAEYEFNFVNETPEGALVFSSRSDAFSPTTIVLQKATPADQELLGVPLSKNLNLIADDFLKFSSTLKLSYVDRDLAFYLSLNDFRRTITFNYVGLNSDMLSGQALNFSTTYLISGNSIVFDAPLNVTVGGSPVVINQINLSETFTETTLNICPSPITISKLEGSLPASNENITLETTLADPTGRELENRADFYFTPLQYIFHEGNSKYNEVLTDVPGAVEFHLYYGLELQSGSTLNAMGFVIRNTDNTVTFALREFTPTFEGNNLIFAFNPELTLFGNTDVVVNEAKIIEYIDNLTEGDKSYVFRINENVFEMYNPCNNWDVVFIAGQ